MLFRDYIAWRRGTDTPAGDFVRNAPQAPQMLKFVTAIWYTDPVISGEVRV